MVHCNNNPPFEGERHGALSPFSILYCWQAETLRDEILRRVYQPSDVLPTKHERLHKSVPMKLTFDTNTKSL